MSIIVAYAQPTEPFVECPICLEPLDKYVNTVCIHKFHPNCVVTWLRKSNTCPLCNIDNPLQGLELAQEVFIPRINTERVALIAPQQLEEGRRYQEERYRCDGGTVCITVCSLILLATIISFVVANYMPK